MSLDTRFSLRNIWFAALLLLLTGCFPFDAEQRIVLKGGDNEAWETEIDIIIPDEFVDNDFRAGLEEEFADAQEEANDQGLSVSYRIDELDDGSLRLRLEAEGEGYDNLEDAVVGSASIDNIVVDGENVVDVEISIAGLLVDDYLMRIEGAEVIESNGDEVGRGVVEWDQPNVSTMRAQIRPKGSNLLRWIALLCLCALGIGVVGGGAGGYLYFQKRNKEKNEHE